MSCALSGALRSPSAIGAAAPKPPPHSVEGRSIFIAIFHCPIKIIQRSKGRSAVAAAAYRSGEKLTNEWDGEIHDYTHKGGIVHQEIMLPTHAPPEFADRSTLWNSVEKIEKSSDAQLAREIEIALPVELSKAEHLSLVRSFVRDNFVAAGMCADFAIHDKGTGNPHAHIMLTMRPLNTDGSWGAKCQKVYDLDEHGQRVQNGKGGWKSHREDITDWNDRGNAEKWRAAWATCVNQALEAAGRPERVDHRSYKRQGIDKIPTIHMGPAASQMERRGIATEKGDINRQTAADNKLLKEIKARITRLYNWTKEQATQPQGGSVLAQLYQAQAEVNASKAKSKAGKVKALKVNATLFNFLQQNGISSMEQLYQKVEAMNSDYYNLRGQIVSAERRISALTERLEMWSQFQQTKPVRQGLDKVKPTKQAQYHQEHEVELSSFDTAVRYLDDLKASGETITPKAWKAEIERLTEQKNLDYQKMRAMRDNLKAVESLRKTAERLASEGQNQHDKKSEER